MRPDTINLHSPLTQNGNGLPGWSRFAIYKPRDKLSDETLPVFAIIRFCGVTVKHDYIAYEVYETINVHAAVVREIDFLQCGV